MILEINFIPDYLISYNIPTLNMTRICSGLKYHEVEIRHLVMRSEFAHIAQGGTEYVYPNSIQSCFSILIHMVISS